MRDRTEELTRLNSELARAKSTAEDANIKKVFTNQCTGCHTPGYPLQFRFDEAGWNKIINLMKRVVGTGEFTYLPFRLAERMVRGDWSILWLRKRHARRL